MAKATSFRMTILWGYPSTSTFDAEVAQCGLGFRAGGLEADAVGPLPEFDVMEGYEEETTPDFDIVWAHYTPDGLGNTTGMTQAAMKAWANEVRTYWTNIRTYHTSKIRLEGVKFTAMDRNGLAIGGSSNTLMLVTPSAGSAGDWLGPAVALGVSLRGPRKGRRGHGRIFLPGIGKSVIGTDGVLATGQGQTYADRTATFIRALNAVETGVGPGGQTAATVATVSQERQEYADVVQVKVGDELDVQNRRRRQRPEIYVSASV